MATITPPLLSIVGSTQPGRSDVTVTYTVMFDDFDVSSGQPYHEHADLIGDDTGTGDGAAAGGDDPLYWAGLGNVHAGFPLQVRTHTFSVPNSALNEDTNGIPNPDEIRARITLTPLGPAVVGPIDSNLVKLTLS
jgi:hypothetical protein